MGDVKSLIKHLTYLDNFTKVIEILYSQKLTDIITLKGFYLISTLKCCLRKPVLTIQLSSVSHFTLSPHLQTSDFNAPLFMSEERQKNKSVCLKDFVFEVFVLFCFCYTFWLRCNKRLRPSPLWKCLQPGNSLLPNRKQSTSKNVLLKQICVTKGFGPFLVFPLGKEHIFINYSWKTFTPKEVERNNTETTKWSQRRWMFLLHQVTT